MVNLFFGMVKIHLSNEMHKKEEMTERKTKSLTQREIRNQDKTRTGRPLRTSTMNNSSTSPAPIKATTTKFNSRHNQNNGNVNKTVI